MTYEQLLEQWNRILSKSVTAFLNDLGWYHPKLKLRILDYGIGYADYFDFDKENTDTDTELLTFLKAICLRSLFLGDEDEDKAVPIDNGRLWELSSSSLSSNQKQLVRLTLDLDEVEHILQNCLKEEDLIHDALFKPIHDQFSQHKHAATRMRYAMEQILIEGST